MKKFVSIILSLLILTTSNLAYGVSYRPTPRPIPQYTQGYNNGYHIGYNKGKNDRIDKEMMFVGGAILVSIGVILIYNLATNSNEQPRDLTHYSMKF